MRHRARRMHRALAAGFLAVAAAGCDRGSASASAMLATGGDPQRGARIIRDEGCGACHTIDGIRGAAGLVGPPLSGLAGRAYIAGSLTNTPDNVVRWIMNPQSIEPGTVMPDLSLSEREARDVAAYLYGLE